MCAFFLRIFSRIRHLGRLRPRCCRFSTASKVLRFFHPFRIGARIEHEECEYADSCSRIAWSVGEGSLEVRKSPAAPAWRGDGGWEEVVRDLRDAVVCGRGEGDDRSDGCRRRGRLLQIDRTGLTFIGCFGLLDRALLLSVDESCWTCHKFFLTVKG